VPIDTLVGTTLAGYALRGKIGEGGTATVFRAEHPQHGTVALKVLKEKLQADPTAVTRFLREAQYGSRVIHPNIVRTLDFGQAPEGNRHYLAIEWAAGELLEKYAERRGVLAPAEVALIVSQIGEAVGAAHQAGIVHRDLKPENVMYDPERQHVKLLDFGIAVDTDAAPDQRLTRAGFFVGSLMYVAPEALSGELVGPAADQYSLATIAYYLLTGVLPYLGKSPRELFTQLLTQPPVGLNKAKPGKTFSAALEAVVMRALSRQPTERHASVQAFARAFAEAVQQGGDPSGTAGAAPAPAGEGGGGGLLGKMKGLFGR
jgi:serine/threonine-protein kinase